MRKKIKSSLFAKVFIITSMMLFGLSLLVFGLLAWLMPQTYSNKLNALLDEQTQGFLSELENVALTDSGGLFDQFARNMEIYSMELYDGNGVFISLPSAQVSSEYGEMNIAVSEEVDSGEDGPVLSGHYYFSFADSEERYMLLVYGKAGQIAELQQAFSARFSAFIGCDFTGFPYGLVDLFQDDYKTGIGNQPCIRTDVRFTFRMAGGRAADG